MELKRQGALDTLTFDVEDNARVALSELAAAVKRRARPPRQMSRLWSYSPLGDLSLIGTTEAQLYLHINVGQKFLNDLREQTTRSDAAPFYQAVEGIPDQYFKYAREEASFGSFPDREELARSTNPIFKTIPRWRELLDWRRMGCGGWFVRTFRMGSNRADTFRLRYRRLGQHQHASLSVARFSAWPGTTSVAPVDFELESWCRQP